MNHSKKELLMRKVQFLAWVLDLYSGSLLLVHQQWLAFLPCYECSLPSPTHLPLFSFLASITVLSFSSLLLLPRPTAHAHISELRKPHPGNSDLFLPYDKRKGLSPNEECARRHPKTVFDWTGTAKRRRKTLGVEGRRNGTIHTGTIGT